MSRPMPMGGSPGGGGAPAPSPAPGGGGPPSQAPANPQQIMLAQIFQVLRRMAQENPAMSAGLQKAAQGIQEAQTAMLTQPQPQPTESNPPQ
jgi:hypothetical protein